MTESELAKNILLGKICENCQFNYEGKCEHGKKGPTCELWFKTLELELKSFDLNFKPKKLNVNWTKEAEIQTSFRYETNELSEYKRFKKWKEEINNDA